MSKLLVFTVLQHLLLLTYTVASKVACNDGQQNHDTSFSLSQSFVYNKNLINIAILIGLVDRNVTNETSQTADSIEQPAPLLNMFTDMTISLFHQNSFLKLKNTQIHVFSDDICDQVKFQSFAKTFPNTKYVFGNQSTFTANINYFVSADILMMTSHTQSMFDHFITEVNYYGIVIKPPIKRITSNYLDIMDFDIASMLAGDMTAFNELLCKRPLYVHTKPFDCNQINHSHTTTISRMTLETMNTVDNIKVNNTNQDALYTAVIVEPRAHNKALKYVLTNFLENLNSSWNIIVFHGAHKNHNIFAILNETNFKSKYQKRVSLVNLGVNSMNITEYNRLLYSKQFYNDIPTEMFLIFQSDSVICSQHKDYINDFLQYDYVGAPWFYLGKPTGVGNGGLSLRRKSKMLDMLNCVTVTEAIEKPTNEDLYFSSNCHLKNGSLITVNKPSYAQAMNFSVETAFQKRSFGAHKAWKWLKPGHYKIFKSFCPEIEIVRKLIH